MRSHTFLYKIQFWTTFIWSFFLCDAYFWQSWALKRETNLTKLLFLSSISNIVDSRKWTTKTQWKNSLVHIVHFVRFQVVILDPRFSKTKEGIPDFWSSIFDRAMENPAFVLQFLEIVNQKLISLYGTEPFNASFLIINSRPGYFRYW